MKIVVTGAGGLLGHHTSVRLHAANCAARFKGQSEPYILVGLDRAAFSDDSRLIDAVNGADAVLHFAGVNRASDTDVASGNPDIARRLVNACRTAGSAPHIVYANSTHAANDSVYGKSKRIAGEILSEGSGGYTDLILPHIFGEGARPHYNNVTATFIAQVIAGDSPEVNPEGRVALLHAGEAAQIAINAAVERTTGVITPAALPVSVVDLLTKIERFHADYNANLFPDLTDPFDLALFNSYRAALYPDQYPKMLRLNSDARGALFEASRGGGGGQTFLSWTHPGVTRGDHFHLDKVERFLVVEGEAIIRIRPVLGDTIWECRVSGDAPAAIDMPTLHTHNIVNVGDKPLLTLFWTNAVFDPAAPDTYADPVSGA
ncbi:UDP-2-acetamido-2,6-beta-L-arabino-hexul-4-ose reductase [Sphingobium wenxiniae]|uniref:UDP-2-acetamido-2,6-beta-L-arabino-hexul-4-ose reductase n=1 Tax=Sphingobium wenxiniae (strain DSM 21828 / CGMCC 1.7748 / JZ-1) TaxID=595605 RepID=A0A562K589_SPHWJ|nr:NAD-dependent epimerase/dehydratase family protein [Sphingobium wenxiniae]MBB6192833.1 UDP-2-acetamido-2,6-beta-L-arabino-hexul-4-ose reductase [Sphingobium wenxiniae]TWH90526.1 UDP-2-acetamido-2,6-beta-L-arabino-hexul-4-ose reductase [Sphingobium wenxiniae]